jgi:large subunit ribosomal protein L5e|mmetsp:Transcript_35149/g.46293  ORF Transcript_35149/g.46293 Transcript_35149/m.46293 type:complete len:287 (+) Transcript_35149:46-906(+)
MGFVKVLKNKAYSKRYQTKFRRRRQGKTDYYARKRLVVNDKDKYDSKKYRMVVRFTNKRVLTSVVYSTIKGDMTVAAADSVELKRFGITCGLTNYAAAYATGLLLARRLLKEKKLDGKFVGQTEADGKLWNIEDTSPERRPFKAYLDVGLVRTTTGNRVFGAMKGACDGGLNIPHNDRRFPGCRMEKPEVQVGKKKGGGVEEKEKPRKVFAAEEHLEHILGVHVQEYYDLLKGENPAAFKKQFSQWEKALKGKQFADLYKAAHADIRKNPDRPKVQRKHAPVRKQI